MKDNDIVKLASDYELAAEELKRAQARFEDARSKLAAAVHNPLPSRERAPSVRRPGGGKKQGVDWEAARTALLKQMRKGEYYCGHELPRLAGVGLGHPVHVSHSRFIANVRDPLLAEGAIKKRHHSGRPWRKGMSPKSVRWVKA